MVSASVPAQGGGMWVGLSWASWVDSPTLLLPMCQAGWARRANQKGSETTQLLEFAGGRGKLLLEQGGCPPTRLGHPCCAPEKLLAMGVRGKARRLG